MSVTPEYLLKVVQATERLTSDLNIMLTRRIVDRILTYYENTGEIQVNAASVYDAMKQVQSGKLLDEVVDDITKMTPGIQEEVKKAFFQTADEIRQQDLEFYQEVVKANKIDIDVPKEITLTKDEMNVLDSFYRRTNGEIRNLTRTTANCCQSDFIDAIDRATFNAKHGISEDEAICNAIDELASRGITTVSYKGGRREKVEVAVARAVRTGINMANADICLMGCAAAGIDYVVVSSHLGARVTGRDDYTDHAHWQGKVYKLDWNNDVLKKYDKQEREIGFWENIRKGLIKIKLVKEYPDFIKECGYGQMLGICGINCRHTFSKFYPGCKNNSIQYDSNVNKKQYELEQQQRAYERKIRELQRRKAAFEQVEQSKDKNLAEIAEDKLKDIKAKIAGAKKEYNKFCKDNGLKKENWRLRTPNSNMKVVETIHKSVGAKSWNYDVYNPKTGEYTHLAEGTRIVQPKNHIMAGNGRERQIDCVDYLIDKYGGDARQWTKEKGFGYVNDEYGEERKVELHWYQHPDIGKVEMKIKYLPGGELYID